MKFDNLKTMLKIEQREEDDNLRKGGDVKRLCTLQAFMEISLELSERAENG